MSKLKKYKNLRGRAGCWLTGWLEAEIYGGRNRSIYFCPSVSLKTTSEADGRSDTALYFISAVVLSGRERIHVYSCEVAIQRVWEERFTAAIMSCPQCPHCFISVLLSFCWLRWVGVTLFVVICLLHSISQYPATFLSSSL